MGVLLVFAGDHKQFVDWMFHRQRQDGGYLRAAREVSEERHLVGVHADEVEDVVLIGTYTENPVWDGDEYRRLMFEAEELGLDWARRPHEDWQRVINAPSPEMMAEARATLQRVERDLDG